MTYSLASSDIWLLLAIIIGGGGRAASFERIVAAGDMVNHAVFTHEELKYGLFRLLDQQLITQSSDGFAPTETALSVANSAKAKARNWLQAWELLNESFGVAEGCDPPNETVLPGYSEEEVALEIDVYRSEALGVISGLLQKTHGITQEEAEELIDETTKKLER